MDLNRLSQIYAYQPGFIYKYNGDVAAGQDVYTVVTSAFVQAASNSRLITNVVDLGIEGIIVYSPVEVSSNSFTLIGPVQEAPVILQVPEPEQEEQQAEQPQEGGE